MVKPYKIIDDLDNNSSVDDDDDDDSFINEADGDTRKMILIECVCGWGFGDCYETVQPTQYTWHGLIVYLSKWLNNHMVTSLHNDMQVFHQESGNFLSSLSLLYRSPEY